MSVGDYREFKGSRYLGKKKRARCRKRISRKPQTADKRQDKQQEETRTRASSLRDRYGGKIGSVEEIMGNCHLSTPFVTSLLM